MPKHQTLLVTKQQTMITNQTLKLHFIKKAKNNEPFHFYISILTVTTACSSLKHKAVVDWPVSPQVQQIPVANDDGRQVFSDDQDIVA